MRVLKRPEVRETVIKSLAAGTSQNNIARDLGVSQPAISHFAAREDVRERIKQEASKIIAHLPVATSNLQFLMNNMQSAITNPKLMELGYRASVKTLEAAGILPTGTPSVIINSFNNSTEISPAVMRIIEAHAGQFPDDPIEAEYEIMKAQE